MNKQKSAIINLQSSMNTKDWIQYSTAIAMILSGIILAFMSFFKNDGDISEGVLWYVAQALTYAGGIFGVSIYFRTKLGDFESRTKREIVEAIVEAEQRNSSKSKNACHSKQGPEDIEPLDMQDM